MQHNDCPIGIPHCPRCAEYAMRGDILEIESLRARADALEAALRRVVTDFDAGYLQPHDLSAPSEAMALARKALANGEHSAGDKS